MSEKYQALLAFCPRGTGTLKVASSSPMSLLASIVLISIPEPLAPCRIDEAISDSSPG